MVRFLSTLSLRRATCKYIRAYGAIRISIHALLAESDIHHRTRRQPPSDFYPRSPCGERRRTKTVTTKVSNFYPRSPCGERHSSTVIVILRKNFYPRSPCGERQSASGILRFYPFISIHALLAESDSITTITICTAWIFLSTLSLRRATDIL